MIILRLAINHKRRAIGCRFDPQFIDVHLLDLNSTLVIIDRQIVLLFRNNNK